MPAILHINDNNLLVVQGDNISRSQGYAWLKAGAVFFDLSSANNAVNNCRVEPQKINSRYWQQCEQTAIASNDSGMRHAADLVWRHLSELKATYNLSDIVFIVPSHYQAKNLQLLLGIAKSCDLHVQGLINKSVYALRERVQKDGQYFHCDVQLHQTVCSEVTVDDGLAKLHDVEILHQVGLQAMQDALLKTIQDRFISSDRFDPLHYAETEQQLFDQLPQLAKQVATHGKGNIQVEYQGQQHLTSIDSKQWHQSIASFNNKLLSAAVEFAPDHRFYDFNGFQAASIDASVIGLPSQLEDIDELQTDQDGNLTYRTEWQYSVNDSESKVDNVTESIVEPSAENSVADLSAAPVSAISKQPIATHLLQAGVAIPLQHAVIGIQGTQLQLSSGTQSNFYQFLQQKKGFIVGDADRQTVQVDDRLASNLADGVITVIHVAQIDELSNTKLAK